MPRLTLVFRKSPASGPLPASTDSLKKKFAEAVKTAITAPSPQALTVESVPRIWQDTLAQVGRIFATHLEKAGLPAIIAPNTLVLRFPARYNSEGKYCEEPDRLGLVTDALRRLTGMPCQLRVETAIGEERDSQAAAGPDMMPEPPVRQRRPLADAEKEPLIQRAIEVLGARFVPGQVDEGFGSAPSQTAERSEPVDTEET